MSTFFPNHFLGMTRLTYIIRNDKLQVAYADKRNK